MAFTFAFESIGSFSLSESTITEMALYPTPNNNPSRRSVQNIRISGSIQAYPDGDGCDATLDVAKWAMASAYEPEAYQSIYAQVESGGEAMRCIAVPEAFVIGYSEKFTVGSDKGKFALTVREYPVRKDDSTENEDTQYSMNSNDGLEKEQMLANSTASNIIAPLSLGSGWIPEPNENMTVFPIPIGSIENPHIIADGETACLSASDEYWFSCTLRGATDFDLASEKPAAIKVYKKTLFGRTELKSVSNSSRLAFTLSDSAINCNSVNYLIMIKPSSSTTVSAKAATHIDTRDTELDISTRWAPSSTSAIFDTNILYYNYWYVHADDVSELVDYINHQSFLDSQSNLANATIASIGLIEPPFLIDPPFMEKIFKKKNILKKAYSLSFFLIGISGPVNFRDSVLANIDKAGEYDKSTNRYSNGLLIIEYMSNGPTHYDVSTWDGSTMYGPKGWTGSWYTKDELFTVS